MGSLQFPNMGMGLRLAAFGRRSSAMIHAKLFHCSNINNDHSYTGVLFAFQVKFWDFNAMDASRRAFRTLQPFECHQIKSIQYSITGDTVLIAAGNAQVMMRYLSYT